MRVLAIFFPLLLLSGCDIVNPSEPGNSDPDPDPQQQLDPTETLLVGLINEARTVSRTCGTNQYAPAPPVTWSSELADAARGHSLDMASKDFFSHTGSDGSSVATRVSEESYSWRYVGENIYGGYNDAERAMQAWLDSPGHCRNIMDPDFEQVGMDVITSTTATYPAYWTQVFASPK